VKESNDKAEPAARDAQRESVSPASRGSLLETLIKRAGRVAGGTLDLAADVATMSAMFGDGWLRDVLSSSASPERLEAMAEAGHFLRDARETAGLSLEELAASLELKDDSVLEGVERGDAILPLEVMLRSASLLARHDPIPFLIKFLRSYNPQLEATLAQWGVMALPKNYERERRFLNLYRQHDFLRDLSDDEYQRFVEYMDSSTKLVVEVMQREGAIGQRRRSGAKVAARAGAATSSIKSSMNSPLKSTPGKSTRGQGSSAKAAPAARQKAKSTARPTVRKVKPRNSDR
jgi:transcriptional regulator with XRE-family HTH domain